MSDKIVQFNEEVIKGQLKGKRSIAGCLLNLLIAIRSSTWKSERWKLILL